MILEQGGSIPDFYYPVGIVLLAMAFLLRGLCRLSKTDPERLIGVKPSVTPFETREEFLKARVEMNLEDFLDKAWITPPCITHTKQCIDIQNLRKKAEPALPDDMASPWIIKDLLPGGCGGSALPPGGAAGYTPQDLRGVATTDMSGAILFNANNIIEKFSKALEKEIAVNKPEPVFEISHGVRVKTGCWYRLRETGELMRLHGYDSIRDRALFDLGGFLRYAGPFSNVELALPKEGEAWTLKPCSEHYPAVLQRSFVMPFTFSEAWEREILCGCLEPLEFGKGKI